MNCNQINIRDPFVLFDNGVYYMYGTRAENFGCKTAGFDVYTSSDLSAWSNPKECFNSEKFGMNREVNWAPEVHKYNGAYYMLATFTMENGRRGTYSLKAESPLGPFEPCSKTALTPSEWECLDGTLYISEDNTPYLIFCHEHTQIIDGTICYAKLNSDLTETTGEVVTLFSASSPYWADKKEPGEHYITDGPFMYRSRTGALFMLWSTFINHKYAECLVKFKDGKLGTNFEHLPPLITDDGGHGMLFKKGEDLLLTFHTPNKTGKERPVFKTVKDLSNELKIISDR